MGFIFEWKIYRNWRERNTNGKINGNDSSINDFWYLFLGTRCASRISTWILCRSCFLWISHLWTVARRSGPSGILHIKRASTCRWRSWCGFVRMVWIVSTEIDRKNQAINTMTRFSVASTYGYPEPGTVEDPLLLYKLPPPVPLLWISPNWAPICGNAITSENTNGMFNKKTDHRLL